MKKKDPSHSGEAAPGTVSTGARKSLAILVILMFFAPFILFIAIQETEPYSIPGGQEFADAVKAAGITVVSVEDSTWNVAGAIGGKTYVLSDENGNTATISTQEFQSDESRDVAFQRYSSGMAGQGMPQGSLYMVGEQLVFVAAADNDVVRLLSDELQKLRSS